MSRPLTSGGTGEEWHDTVRYVSRLSTARGTAALQVSEHSGYGWARWSPAVDATGAPLRDSAYLAEAGVYAPGWTHGWRRALLRALWAGRPRSGKVSDLSLDQGVVLLLVFWPSLIWLGPHLRGSTALTVPVALALLVSVGIPALARHLTRHRVRLCPTAGCATKVLAARQTLARAVAVSGGQVPEIEQAEEVGHWLLWHTADPHLAPETGQALAEAARSLAASAYHAGTHVQLLAQEPDQHSPGLTGRIPIRTDALTCHSSHDSGIPPETVSRDGIDTQTPPTSCGKGVYPRGDIA